MADSHRWPASRSVRRSASRGGGSWPGGSATGSVRRRPSLRYGLWRTAFAGLPAVLSAGALRAEAEAGRVEAQPDPSAVALRFATGYGGQPSLACQPFCPPERFARRRKLAGWKRNRIRPPSPFASLRAMADSLRWPASRSVRRSASRGGGSWPGGSATESVRRRPSLRYGLWRKAFAGLPAVAGRQANEGWRRGSESDVFALNSKHLRSTLSALLKRNRAYSVTTRLNSVRHSFVHTDQRSGGKNRGGG